MRKLFFFLMSLIVVSLVACSREESVINNPNLLKKQSVDYDLNSDRNVRSDALAFAVHQALRQSPEFSVALKKEVLKRVSGDYEVLLSNFSAMSITDSSPVTRMEDVITVGELLDGYLVSGVQTKSSGSFIADLQNQYPNMQISVPVHAEDWDVENYIPTVVFVPEEFSDGETQFVPGYNSEGESVLVDAINEPSEPVVVIGMSERAGIVLPELPEQPEVPTPSAPTSLVATQSAAGIMLTWQSSGSCTGYKVYRKVAASGSYAAVKTLYGSNNVVYEDQNIEGSVTYSYYVLAFNLPTTLPEDREQWAESFVYSSMSNVVVAQAPALPLPLTSFEATLNGRNVELRWAGSLESFSETEIFSMWGDQASYSFLESFDALLSNYIYAPPIRGEKVSYAAKRTNPMGSSSMLYDFLYPPYRNTSSVSPVYIRGVQCTGDVSEIESWILGSPEFYVKVYMATPSGQVTEVQQRMNFETNSRSNEVHYFQNRKAYDWYCLDVALDWSSTLTFSLVEYDDMPLDGDVEVDASVGISRKKEGALEFIISTLFKFLMSAEDIYCGSAYLKYFEEPERWLDFPNNGMRILVSESGN